MIFHVARGDRQAIHGEVSRVRHSTHPMRHSTNMCYALNLGLGRAIRVGFSKLHAYEGSGQKYWNYL